MDVPHSMVLQPSVEEPAQINPSDLFTLFDRYSPNIKVLSLDCFDTLIWRKVLAPKDVFYEMQQYPLFQSLGITAANRIDAESYARHLMFARQGVYEVSLEDIYRAGFPSLSDEEIAALIEQEIQAEIENCFALPAVIKVLRAAIARGIKIIIVSNTYLKKSQLQRLLASKLPPEVMNKIDAIFCSCEYLASKTTGLFAHVLQQIKEPVTAIWHAGDDYESDYFAPRCYGITATRLVSFNKKLAQLLRLQATASTIADASIHHTRPMATPFRALLSSNEQTMQTPASLIGYASVGPIMYAFAHYLVEEIEQLKKAGKRPKVLFMMRDAYLPALACKELVGEEIGTRIHISRFSAVAVSFFGRKEIEGYLGGGILGVDYLYVHCRQLLMTEEEQEKILAQVKIADKPVDAFIRLILTEQNIATIVQRSSAYRERLKKYLQRQGIETGDTLVMVDLGYVGRTQRCLTPMLEKELGVQVTGRYLISLNILEWRKSRKGLIDPSWCDDRTMQMLSFGNPLLEELCCSADGSVQDYTVDGTPIFAVNNATEGQINKTRLIQAECLRFIRDAKIFFSLVSTRFTTSMFRDAALAELSRRAFLPVKDEMTYLEEYLHDENFGTDLTGVTFNTLHKELIDLRQRGLCFKKHTPYGLYAASFELSLALMAQQSRGFDLNLEDLSMRRENILTLLVYADQTATQQIIDCSPTHDGYFSLWWMVDDQDCEWMIRFGLNYKLLQIESISLIKAEHFYQNTEEDYSEDIRSAIHLHQMTEQQGNLFECASQESTLIIRVAAGQLTAGKKVIRVAFRPIC